MLDSLFCSLSAHLYENSSLLNCIWFRHGIYISNWARDSLRFAFCSLQSFVSCAVKYPFTRWTLVAVRVRHSALISTHDEQATSYLSVGVICGWNHVTAIIHTSARAHAHAAGGNLVGHSSRGGARGCTIFANHGLQKILLRKNRYYLFFLILRLNGVNLP